MKKYIRASAGSPKVTGATWQKFLENIESQTPYSVDDHHWDEPDSRHVVLWKDGKRYDTEITRYSDGEYELMLQNIPKEGEVLSSVTASRKRPRKGEGDYTLFICYCEDTRERSSEVQPTWDQITYYAESEWDAFMYAAAVQHGYDSTEEYLEDYGDVDPYDAMNDQDASSGDPVVYGIKGPTGELLFDFYHEFDSWEAERKAQEG